MFTEVNYKLSSSHTLNATNLQQNSTWCSIDSHAIEQWTISSYLWWDKFTIFLSLILLAFSRGSIVPVKHLFFKSYFWKNTTFILSFQKKFKLSKENHKNKPISFESFYHQLSHLNLELLFTIWTFIDDYSWTESVTLYVLSTLLLFEQQIYRFENYLCWVFFRNISYHKLHKL